jgi:hypothetical protein
MVNLEPNVMVYMLVLVLTHPKLGVVAAMDKLRVSFPRDILIKFLWERIAVMDCMPALNILSQLCKVEAMLKLVQEVGE